MHIQDLFLFVYYFFVGKIANSFFVFNLFLANINTALQAATFRSVMQREFSMEQGPFKQTFQYL